MALKNIIDPDTARPQLERWYATSHPEAQDIRVTDVDIPSANGMSSETILFNIAWTENGQQHSQPSVARVTPTAEGLLPEYNLTHERQVIDAVAASTTVRVPVTYGVETDASVLGAPFLVMERLDGRVPTDDPPFTAAGWVTELSITQQARMYDNALVAMAGIQSADISGFGRDTVGHPGRDGSPLAQQIAHYERLYAWAAGDRVHPTIDGALEWLHTNFPAYEAPPGLSWGDARVGNMMFGEDLRITGVLDWEMATIGEAELDLAWFLFLNRTYTEGMGLPAVPGWLSTEATITRYEQLIGRPLLNFHFHEILAATRASIMMMRIGMMMIEAGLLPEDASIPINNPASQLLATIIGQPMPSEAPAWISGHRNVN
ncbi:phosphotransferase family protein [Mycobacterium sp.]|uniref:phosphotransferase family protein n=1 Tax=Mycobacterium sp. TaxID=1785 RepID=UPI00121A072C|nr:phosphotransferase family protein [Mycobacterium sp.]TAM64426.1 MAG: phosphotransferase family protein [Mycobacterium sp.]